MAGEVWKSQLRSARIEDKRTNEKPTEEANTGSKRCAEQRGEDEQEVEIDERFPQPSLGKEVGRPESEEDLHRRTDELGEKSLNHARPVGAEDGRSGSVLPDCTKKRRWA